MAVRHGLGPGALAAGERVQLSKHAEVAKAIDYLLSPNHWPDFIRFLEDGRICLTNNAAEHALGGEALGRKSWLFAGARASASAKRPCPR
jgi:transposase